MPLTDTALKALKPQDKPYTVSDGRGLYAEVLSTGSVVWRFRYRLNGKQEKLTLGRYPDLSLKMARLRRDEAARAVALGQSPVEAKRAAKAESAAQVTVREFGERYFREIVAKDRKDSTLPRRYFDKSIVPALGNLQMQEVSVDDVRSVIWAKKEQGFDAAAGQIRGLLKRLFDYGMTCGVTPSNPVLALPMRHIHRGKPRERALSPEEIGVFLRASYHSNIRRQFKLALHLTLLTLARKSELLEARWSDVDLAAREWNVPAHNSKTGQPHTVYLSTQAAALFEELRRLASGSEYVLPSRSSLKKPFAKNALNKALIVAMAGQDIPAFTIHDLRRTASTLLHEQGWNSDVVEKALNHTIGGVRGVYNRAQYAEQRRGMLQSWADFVDQLLLQSASRRA